MEATVDRLNATLDRIEASLDRIDASLDRRERRLRRWVLVPLVWMTVLWGALVAVPYLR
jgi:hypothetical protein